MVTVRLTSLIDLVPIATRAGPPEERAGATRDLEVPFAQASVATADGRSVFFSCTDKAIRRLDPASGAVEVVVAGLHDTPGIAIAGDLLFVSSMYQEIREAHAAALDPARFPKDPDSWSPRYCARCTPRIDRAGRRGRQSSKFRSGA
jgi:hypothetical protein